MSDQGPLKRMSLSGSEIIEIEIHLENLFFPWTKSEDSTLTCWLKGDLFYNNNLQQAPEVLSLIRALLDHSDNNNDTLSDLFLRFNGSFALVVQTPDDILCVVDRIRSIPLFYAKTDSRFIIDDDANRIQDQTQSLFHEKNGAEFLVTGYVTGRETLFDGICQIQAGEYLRYSRHEDHPTTFFYHRFWHEDYFSDSEEDLLHRLDEVFIAVFKRLVVSAQQKGLPIVVP